MYAQLLGSFIARCTGNHFALKATEKLVKCYYALEDYASLEGMIDLMQPNSPILEEMGTMFAGVGMGKSVYYNIRPQNQHL
jgi:hypothetical protein